MKTDAGGGAESVKVEVGVGIEAVRKARGRRVGRMGCQELDREWVRGMAEERKERGDGDRNAMLGSAADLGDDTKA